MVSMETQRELVAAITDLTARLFQRLSDEDVDERAHMRKQCSPEAQDALAQMSVEALHLLDAIPAEGGGSGAETVNVVGLSKVTGSPKGTVSKRLQRLAEIGVVERRQLPGNRKEVHVRPTPIGLEIQAAHRDLHQQMSALPEIFLRRYSVEELEVIARVLDDFVRMPREGVRFRPDLLD